MVAALTGDWRREHLFTLRQARRTFDYYHTLIAECDAEIEAWLATHTTHLQPPAAPLGPGKGNAKPRKNEIQLPTLDLRAELYRIYGFDLTLTPGLGVLSVHTLYAELGPDLAAFGSAGRFASWLGLCPDPRVSGGKVLRRKTRGIQHRVARIFRLAAQTLLQSDTPLGGFGRRLRAKLGPRQAITALAHKLARIYYTLVTQKEAYDESHFAAAEEHYQKRRLQHLRREAAALGLQLTPMPAVS